MSDTRVSQQLPEKLEDFYKLDNARIAAKEYLLKAIQDPNLKEAAITKFITLGWYTLFALSENSKDINEMLKTNSDFKKRCHDFLQQFGRPTVELEAYDGSMRVGLFDQIKGLLIWQAFKPYLESKEKLNLNASALLNKACEIGTYEALIYRLNTNKKMLFDDVKPDEVDNLVRIIQLDAEKLGSLYGAMGCADAGISLMQVASYYFNNELAKPSIERFFMPIANFSWIKFYEKPTRPLAILLLEKSVEYLYLAQMQADAPLSQVLSECYLGSKNPLKGLKDGFDDPQGVVKFVKDHLGAKDLNIPLPESFLQQAQNHAMSRLSCS